ncbi:DUF1742-domain-containing protein [Exidia glandulosa HHB12029]|uniref:DUF1742-domain-containing protein n=1 Tax=Exidia glandulosa HHB12029 TaxID=1314781 RepID=A0A165GHA4_EXIGL|nr:DUF1742-domain-containing protein [Exidia glandulosa HHB12029]
MATFANVYYKRAVATAKPCSMCYRPTTTVLATVNATDFIYTCDMHLSDNGFATRIPEPESPAAKPSVSTEEILKLKKEWEERQKKKDEKEKDKDDKDKDKKVTSKPSTPTPVSSPAPAPAPPKHEKYSLHRDIFAMRQTEHRKRRNAAQAKEVAPRIPSAPRSSVE